MASARDGRYNTTSLNLESFTCSVCGKRRHTGRHNIRHDKCSKIKQQQFEQQRVEEMAARLERAIEAKRSARSKQ